MILQRFQKKRIFTHIFIIFSWIIMFSFWELCEHISVINLSHSSMAWTKKIIYDSGLNISLRFSYNGHTWILTPFHLAIVWCQYISFSLLSMLPKCWTRARASGWTFSYFVILGFYQGLKAFWELSELFCKIFLNL